MTWGAVAGAAISVVGSQMSSGGGGGGAGTSTTSKEPWLQAQPWIMNNLQQGQNLQQAYTNQPFSQMQTNAYGNQAAQSDYMRAAVPSLLGQLSGKQVGFDRSNPNARPQSFDFNNLMGAAGAGGAAAGQGALSRLNSGPSLMGGLAQQTPQVAPPPQSTSGTFVNAQPVSLFAGATPNSGYGAFKYGEMPAPGSQADSDMRLYFAMGGADPNELYAQARGFNQGYDPYHNNVNPNASQGGA